MSNIKNNLKLGAIAVALSLSAAMPVEVPYAAGLIGAPAAQAGVWGSVKSGAKAVGGAAKAVGSEYKRVASDTARHAKRALQNDRVQLFGRVNKELGKGIGRGVKNVGKGVGIVLATPFTYAVCGDVGRCKFNPPGLGPNLNKPLPKPPAGGPGSWGGNARPSETVPIRKPADTAPPNQGISKPDLGIKQDKSVWGRPVGVSKPKLGNDKSVWGRPVGVSKPKLTQGSTRDLKPMRQSMSRKGR
jgi:hypothetical protein